MRESLFRLTVHHHLDTYPAHPLQLGVPFDVNIILQWVRTIHTYANNADQSFLNVTTADAADIKNRVQVLHRGCE